MLEWRPKTAFIRKIGFRKLRVSLPKIYSNILFKLMLQINADLLSFYDKKTTDKETSFIDSRTFVVRLIKNISVAIFATISGGGKARAG